jgi:hypothetical protein
MPTFEAIYHTGRFVFNDNNRSYQNNGLFFVDTYTPRSCYLAYSGITAGGLYETVVSAADVYLTGANPPALSGYPLSALTVGSITAGQNFVLAPADLSLSGKSQYFSAPVTLSLVGANYANMRTVSFGLPNFSGASIGSWQVTQDANKNVLVTCTSFGLGDANKIFVAYEDNAENGLQPIPVIWKVTLQNHTGETIATQNVRPSVTTVYPSTSFGFANIASNGTYNVLIQRKIRGSAASGQGPTPSGEDETYLNHHITTALTAPAVTSGGGESTNMFSWLNNDYWYLTDLQVNLGTRAVTHRHGTVEIKPNDTINFAVLFHDGSAGVNPVATDLRLAVRSSANTSAYHFWSAATVTTASVNGDVYYTLTVTASDEDLLAAQAAGLLAGSNAAQSLLAEVQWTTTRGTFSSDTFTISVPNEVVREPDV